MDKRERVARAIATALLGDGKHWETYVFEADAAIAALEPVTVQEAREEALRDAADKCSLKLAEPWTDTTTIIPHEYTAEVIRRKITALIEKDKTDG